MKRQRLPGTSYLFRTIAENVAGLWALRGPIFRRKGHAPESRARRRKFQTDLRLAATHRTEKRHLALLFLFRFVVLHVNHCPAGQAGVKQDQGAVGIYGQRLRVFVEFSSFSVLSTYA